MERITGLIRPSFSSKSHPNRIITPTDCHSEQSEESAFVCDGEQLAKETTSVPHGTIPTSLLFCVMRITSKDFAAL
jgi:hypothetical protein